MARLLPMLERHNAGHTGPLAAIADLIFVINLKTSNLRLGFQQDQANRLGYSFYRFPGILGRNLEPGEIPTALVSAETVQSLLERNPGGLGQGIAYLELLGAIAAMENANARVLVLEDDAEFQAGAAEIPAALAALPPDWDIVTLGICSWNQGGLIASWDYDGDPQPRTLTPNLREQRGGYQLIAWLYSVKGARKLLAGLLPWHDELNYRRFHEFLRHKKFRGMIPTPGSLDLFLQVQLADLAAFHVHQLGADLVSERQNFPSTIAPQGRRY